MTPLRLAIFVLTISAVSAQVAPEQIQVSDAALKAFRAARERRFEPLVELELLVDRQQRERSRKHTATEQGQGTNERQGEGERRVGHQQRTRQSGDRESV